MRRFFFRNSSPTRTRRLLARQAPLTMLSSEAAISRPSLQSGRRGEWFWQPYRTLEWIFTARTSNCESDQPNVPEQSPRHASSSPPRQAQPRLYLRIPAGADIPLQLHLLETISSLLTVDSATSLRRRFPPGQHDQDSRPVPMFSFYKNAP